MDSPKSKVSTSSSSTDSNPSTQVPSSHANINYNDGKPFLQQKVSSFWMTVEYITLFMPFVVLLYIIYHFGFAASKN